MEVEGTPQATYSEWGATGGKNLAVEVVWRK